MFKDGFKGTYLDRVVEEKALAEVLLEEFVKWALLLCARACLRNVGRVNLAERF